LEEPKTLSYDTLRRHQLITRFPFNFALTFFRSPPTYLKKLLLIKFFLQIAIISFGLTISFARLDLLKLNINNTLKNQFIFDQPKSVSRQKA
jgi:hypothetical protein